MRSTLSCLFQASGRALLENPLGLPRTGSFARFQRGLPERRPIRNVGKVVAVASAKGGVGKSTVAANLSLAFVKLGYRVGILDMDVYGPSIPTLFRLAGRGAPRTSANGQLIPMQHYGVKTMSMGYLVGPDEAAPIVWRGPMLSKAVQQLLHETDWGPDPGLDVLVLDLPPGTGDIQLSITQMAVVDGAVIVTTPHTLAVKDAVKGVNMFRKTNIPILGLVQNMSVFKCSHCEHDTEVFGSNVEVKAACKEHEMEFLGDIPLHPKIGEHGMRGIPTVVAEQDGDRSEAFVNIAKKVASGVGLSTGQWR